MMRDTLRLLYPSKDYTLENHAIGYLTSHTECQLAEELFTRCGNGYYYDGIGLSVHDAGINNSVSDTGEMKRKDVREA